MRKILLSVAVFSVCVLALFLFASPDAFAKAKKSKKKSKKSYQPRINGIEAMIEAQKRGEAIEIVDPDNPKKRIRIEPPKAQTEEERKAAEKEAKKEEEAERKKSEKEAKELAKQEEKERKAKEKAEREKEIEKEKTAATKTPESPPPVAVESTPETSLVPAAPPPPPVIVIDPGHGGKDPGAMATFGKKKKAWSVREKDVTLQISKHLEASLKKRLKAKVYYTRPNDTFITLGERNRIANRRQCDIFLSIHANAAKNPKAKGLEIYSLNKATDEAASRLAARENAGAPAQEKDIEAIVSDLTQTAAAEESALLAGNVEKSFRKRLKPKYGIERLETKTALFFVLVGAKCPGLLIETGFVTNEEEGKRLKQPAYQKDMAKAIAEGVADYLSASEAAGGDL